MNQLTDEGIDFDYFVYENDIRLNIFDNDVVSYYSSLPLVTDVDPEKYDAILGEYDRKISASVFEKFLSRGKKVIGFDYSTFDLYSGMLEGVLKFPIPVTHWLTTNDSLSHYVRSNPKISRAEYIKTVGNLYLENARQVQDVNQKSDVVVFCTNSYIGAIKDPSTALKFSYKDNIRKIEDRIGCEIKIRLHPSMYSAYSQIIHPGDSTLNGGVGFQTPEKASKRLSEFKVHKLEQIYDKIIDPSEVLKLTSNCRAAILTIPTSTMRELVLNKRHYFCNTTPCKTQYKYFHADNRMLRSKVKISRNFFPLMKDRFIDLNVEDWIPRLSDYINSTPKFSSEYLDYQQGLLSESMHATTNIFKSIKEILNEL